MIPTLHKTIVAQFYKLNAGFFLVCFILLFGILSGRETIYLHCHLMLQITTSWLFMVGAAIIWLLYSIKCVGFALREFNNPANRFLYSIQSIRNIPQLLIFTHIHALLLAPVLIYGAITVLVGFTHHSFLLPILFVIFQSAITITGGFIYRYIINNTHKPALFKTIYLSTSRPIKLHMCLLHYSVHMRKGTFVVIKLFSLLLLQGMITANKLEQNRESVCVLMMFFGSWSFITCYPLCPLYRNPTLIYQNATYSYIIPFLHICIYLPHSFFTRTAIFVNQQSPCTPYKCHFIALHCLSISDVAIHSYNVYLRY